jgi:hypothetical protein
LQRVRSWSPAVFVAILPLILASCGGSSEEDQIRELVTDYYEHSAAAQCKALTTEQFREAVYGGSGEAALPACEEHQRLRGETPKIERTAFVDHVQIDGDRAVAEVRGGGVTLTDQLIKTDDGWKLDDEVSPFHRSANAPEFDLEEEGEPQAFGTPAQFSNIPGISGPMAITLVVQDPIDPGVERSGATRAKARIGNPFGKPGPVQEIRFINLPITLINTGKRLFRGDIGVFATDEHGREFTPLDLRELTQSGGLRGRAPDWAEGEAKGIQPGVSVTRYLTIPLPIRDRIVEWRVEPNVLSEPHTLSSMEPLEGVTYSADAG